MLKVVKKVWGGAISPLTPTTLSFPQYAPTPPLSQELGAEPPPPPARLTSSPGYYTRTVIPEVRRPVLIPQSRNIGKFGIILLYVTSRYAT